MSNRGRGSYEREHQEHWCNDNRHPTRNIAYKPE